VALATGALGTVAALVAEPSIVFLFGPSFIPAVAPLTWLIPGAVAFATYSLLMSYFYAIGTPAATIIFPAIGLLVNVGLNLTLIPVYGLVGTAVASSIAYGGMLLLAVARFGVRRSGGEMAA
jgi:O-antigen/teichoic acid export membrane protein